jgi:hypothetical protein
MKSSILPLTRKIHTGLLEMPDGLTPFNKAPIEEENDDVELDEEEKTNTGEKIYCPLCAWKPLASSRWSCFCQHVWNTFNTRGLCPACGKQWEDTVCLECHRWSRHEEWYHED